MVSFEDGKINIPMSLVDCYTFALCLIQRPGIACMGFMLNLPFYVKIVLCNIYLRQMQGYDKCRSQYVERLVLDNGEFIL